MKKYLLYILLPLICSCAGAKLPPIAVPEVPNVLPVIVKDGTIEGESVDNVVINHSEVWTYVYRLRALLGKKDKITVKKLLQTTSNKYLKEKYARKYFTDAEIQQLKSIMAE